MARKGTVINKIPGPVSDSAYKTQSLEVMAITSNNISTLNDTLIDLVTEISAIKVKLSTIEASLRSIATNQGS